MKKLKKRLYLGLILSVFMIGLYSQSNYVMSAEPLIIEPLFQYPTAPDDITDLVGRSDYLMEHFWDTMDLTSSETVDQNALNDAFEVYTSAMPFSTRDAVLKSVDKLISRLKGNPVLTIQFMKAAEESLYGPRANMWSDEVYVPFLKAVVTEKGISETRKARYAHQLKKLTTTSVGKKAPSFRYRRADGHYRDFKVMKPYTIIEFGDPECDDCKFSRMKLEMASDLSDWVEDNKVEIFFIIPDVAPDEEEQAMKIMSEYPEKWNIGIGYGIDDIYDLRTIPSFYLLGHKGEIVFKNADVSATLSRLRDIMKQN